MFENLRRFLAFKEVVGNESGIGILAGLGIAAALGLLKSEAIDRPKEKRQRKLKATEIRLSPFTKIDSTTQIQEASPAGTALQFGAAGAGLAQNIQTQSSTQELNKAIIAALESGRIKPPKPSAFASLGINPISPLQDQSRLFPGGFNF